MSWRRFTFKTMGTVGNVLYPATDETLEAAINTLWTTYESTFSLHAADSELSRVNRHELAMTDASDLLREGYSIAMDWYNKTDALFTPYPHDLDIDLNGVVKAMAIDATGKLLRASGIEHWSINVGGDVLVAGQDELGQRWKIGLVDPLDRGRLSTVVELDDTLCALATSGTSERGEHIWGTPGHERLRQASVLGVSILEADVLATTAIAAGSVERVNELLAADHVGIMLHGLDGQAYGNRVLLEHVAVGA